MKNFRLLSIKAVLFFMLINTSCKKLTEVESPYNKVTQESAFADNLTASAVVTGFYAEMSRVSMQTTTTGFLQITKYAGLSSDEFTLNPAVTNTTWRGYYRNNLSPISPGEGNHMWNTLYAYIYKLNSALTSLNLSTGLSSNVKSELSGEVKFLRAFAYFYLTNLYGDIPLILSTDYEVNSLLQRTKQSDIYKQIIEDLSEAKQGMSDAYLGSSISSPTIERTRPNKFAAAALLARVYLYSGDWTNAEVQSTEIINKTSLYTLTSLNGSFLKNSNEAIWQLQPVNAGWNTEDARLFILPASGPNTSGNYLYLSQILLNSFELNDLRRTSWTKTITVPSGANYTYAYKYKSATLNNPVTEYHTVFRLAEQFLIRAEARAQKNDLTGATADLNIIRNRAGLSNTTAVTQPDILTAILHERQVELFSEWGHRWFDLKRTNTVDAVMTTVTAQKGGTWSSFRKFFPISQSELDKAINLTQTPGY